jgi:CheY-like chemotaxis protein
MPAEPEDSRIAPAFLAALLPARVGSPAGMRKPARLVARRLQATVGQSLIIENQAGAGRTIGTKQAAIAAPDGSAQELEQNGFHVLEAGTGNEAVEILNGASGVDLVFTDVRMPGTIDGVALMRWVQKERPDIKVMIASAIRIEDADATVVKPYSMTRVIQTIRGLLGFQRAAEVARSPAELN